MGDDPSIRKGSGGKKCNSVSTGPPCGGRTPTSGDSSRRPESFPVRPAGPPDLTLDIAWLLAQHVERCLQEGHPVLTVSTQGIRSELMSMGYLSQDLDEPTLRTALRRLTGDRGEEHS